MDHRGWIMDHGGCLLSNTAPVHKNGQVSYDFQAAASQTPRGRNKKKPRSVTVGWLQPTSKEMRRKGCIKIWSSDGVGVLNVASWQKLAGARIGYAKQR